MIDDEFADEQRRLVERHQQQPSSRGARERGHARRAASVATSGKVVLELVLLVAVRLDDRRGGCVFELARPEHHRQQDDGAAV